MGATGQSMGNSSEFHEEAAALRDAAEITESEITRATLLELAEEFDRMAANPVKNYPKKLPRYIR